MNECQMVVTCRQIIRLQRSRQLGEKRLKLDVGVKHNDTAANSTGGLENNFVGCIGIVEEARKSQTNKMQLRILRFVQHTLHEKLEYGIPLLIILDYKRPSTKYLTVLLEFSRVY